MADIKPGLYSVGELLDAAGVDAQAEAAVDYNESGYDLRRVQVGGLPFDDFDQQVRVPEGSDAVEVTVDQEVVATLNVVADEA